MQVKVTEKLQVRQMQQKATKKRENGMTVSERNVFIFGAVVLNVLAFETFLFVLQLGSVP